MYTKWDVVLLGSLVIILVIASFLGWWIIIFALVPFLGIYIQEIHVGEKLQQSEERYRQLVEASPESILVSDLRGMIQLVDEQAIQMLGYKHKDEIIGKSGFDFIVPEDREYIQKKLTEVMNKGKVTNAEYTSIRKSGERFPTLGNAALIRDTEGKPISIMIVVRDVTKEKEIETAKSDFFANAAHQLRTPLSALRWDMELMMNRKELPTPETQRKMYDRMYRQITKLISVVNTMLDSSLMVQGVVRSKPQRVRLSEVIDGKVREFSEYGKSSGIDIVQTHKDLGEAYIDPAQLGEVVGNLIANAIKYCNYGNEVRVVANRQGQKLHIEIVDEGIGIPREEQPYIFTKFFRTKQAKKIDPEGSGLGLYTIKTYVDYWGGIIRFESPVKGGRGTKFSIDIPLKEVI